jgi:hypothetical protein
MKQSNLVIRHISRTQAFTLHLISSAVVLLLFYFFISNVLYPDSLFFGAHAFEIFKILVPIDLILGPMIMLIIFNPKKTSLKFDVTCVLLFQIAFFLFGAWTLYTARPAFMVFTKDAFYLATANQIDPTYLAKAKDRRFQKVPILGPEWVAARSDLKNHEEVDVMLSMAFGFGIQHFPQHYLPIDSKKQQEILNQAKPIEKLSDLSKEVADNLHKFKNSNLDQQILFMPLFTKQSTLYVAINGKSGKILKIL